MPDQHDNQSRFVHAFSSPLTALRGAIDLLRQRQRAASDPVTQELLATLERNCARLRAHVETLLKHSRVDAGVVEIIAPLDTFGIASAPAVEALPEVAARRIGAAAPTLAEPAAASETLPQDACSILIIGDSLLDGQTIETALRAAGHAVQIAPDGASGIDTARTARPDLIVLDLDLSPPGAEQIAEVLREDPETKTIPMIYATGRAQPPARLPPHVELLPRGAGPAALLALVCQTIAAAQTRATQTPTLLIVDDDADIQRIVTLQLQQNGYRVVPAATGAAALRAAQKQPFDLIILDLLLPDIDGFAVLAALRARTATAMTPIILLSAQEGAAEKVRGLQLGADDYVTKPFSPAELQARVRAALRRHEREAGANPSTRLPGNIAIERALRRRIAQGVPFAVCYADIDNFKAYNDTFSFLKGDAVIQQTAHVLLDAVERAGNRDDFVGHIGGDDFVVITTPDRAEALCRHAMAHFDTLAPLFYDTETRARGYIDALDRQGRPARYPFVSLSIGVVISERRPIGHVAEVAQRSVELKKRAKDLPGSALVLED